MKIFNTSLSDIARSNYLFLSLRFHEIANYLEENKKLLQNRVGDYFEIVSGNAFKSSDYDSEGIKLIRIGDITKDGEINLEETVKLPEDFEEKFKKYLLQQNDILIAMTGATIGKTGFLGTLSEKLFLNQRVGALRVKSEDINTKFFYYLTKGNLFQKQIKINAMGKSQDNVSPFDILDIKIPYVKKTIQDETLKKIKPIEREIENLQAQIGAPTETINRVFAREFNYDESLWFEFGKGMTAGTQKSELKKANSFLLNFQDFAKSRLLRFSTRFHNPLTQELNKTLHNFSTYKVKSILIEPVHRGKQPIADENGTIYAIKTGQLKNNHIDLENCQFVNDNFFEKNPNAQTRKGDILIASTGKVSLGKIDIVDFDDEIQAVVDSHISILRINENLYNKQFFIFFFRSILGAFQIERDFTGATNQIELSASEIEEFDIPNISLNKQAKIVDEIQVEFSAQSEIKRKIEDKRKEIDRIIEEVLK